MFRLARTLVLLSLIVVAGTSKGDDAFVVFPVSAWVPVAGANGSLWATEIVARNVGSEIVYFSFYDCGDVVCPEPYEQLAPNETKKLLYNTPDGATAVLRTNGPVKVVFSERVRDLSRQSDTWGTEIPVVQFDQAGTSTIHLLNIPATSDFRTTLRIYAFSYHDPRSFRITVHPLESNDVLAQRIVSTSHLQGRGITQVSVGDDLFSGLKVTPVRVEISPVTDNETKFYAFASVTNNRTQHVTVVVQRP